ncbi:hypothetical protein [Dyadobacter sp. 676]|uniref:Uncharacterized protein n=1 Tax=Dyadobacter sp. 676 TaxID=3088362 RepID=A0AAU8FLP0_9BACT
MKVEKAVGWVQGANGTGVVYEISHNGGYLLAVIWQDNKFHHLTLDFLAQHIAEAKGALTAPRTYYLPEGSFPVDADGTLPVSNPDGWKRLYETPTPASGTTTEADELEIPVSVSFSGTLKLKMGGVSALLKLFE